MSSPVVIVQPRLALEDPHDCTDANDMLAVFDALFDGLVRYGKDGGYVPALSKRLGCHTRCATLDVQAEGRLELS
ncbi:MAG: hypothetical protein U5N27_09175 [Rhizobium sp.]|nr:hypothetical protein [Rhizobium sp.]